MTDQHYAVLLGLIAYVTANIGMGVQKLGAEALARLSELFKDKHVGKRFLQWLFGIAMTIVGTLLLFPALAMGSAGVIFSLGGVGLVTLAVFSALVLKEPIGKREGLGIGLIAIGTGLAGYFGPAKSEHPADLKAMAIYGAIFLVAVMVALLMARNREGTLPAAAFGASSGGFAGFGLILQKLAGEVGLTLANPFAFGWLLMTGGAFSLLQLAYLKGRAVVVVPSYTCTSIVIPVAGAAVVFSERLEGLLFFGLLLLLVGVVLLAYNPELENPS